MSDAGAQAQRGAKFREALATLNLTAEEQEKVKTVLQAARARGAGGERGAVMRELAAVLSPEQVAALRAKLGV